MEKTWNYLKMLAEKLQQPTMQKLIKLEKKYNDREELLEKTEKEYMKLELREDHQKLIEDMLSLRMEIDCDYNDMAYLAGLIDCLTFLIERGLIE